ncbi:MAG: hypothetical protein MJZ03_00730 [archaeon]|nr:hypothetical protein [archaeon]
MGEKLTKLQASMDEKYNELAIKVDAWNKASIKDDEKTMKILGKEIDNLVGEYTKAAREACFETVYENASFKAENVLIEGVKMLEYETINAKSSMIPEAGFEEMDIITVNKPIDPLDLQKYISTNIGKNDKWQYLIERFNFLMTVRIATDIGMSTAEINKIHDSYSMHKITKAIDDGGTPQSNTKMIDAMQEIINACIGDTYKVTSHDVKYLLYTYAGKDRKKKRTIKVAQHKQLRILFMDVMNNLVLFSDKKDAEGKKISGYGITYKQKKPKNNAPSGDKEGFTPIPPKESPENPPKSEEIKNETLENQNKPEENQNKPEGNPPKPEENQDKPKNKRRNSRKSKA